VWKDQKIQFDAMLNEFYDAVANGTHTPTTTPLNTKDAS
jgi:hypothetical protein